MTLQRQPFVKDLGVVVVDLQSHRVMDPERGMIQHVMARHDITLVLIKADLDGPTVERPLTYAMRSWMLQQEFPQVWEDILIDQDDKLWSKDIDEKASRLVTADVPVMIWFDGDADYWRYSGSHLKEKAPRGDSPKNIDIMASVAGDFGRLMEFRAGVVWAARNLKATTPRAESCHG